MRLLALLLLSAETPPAKAPLAAARWVSDWSEQRCSLTRRIGGDPAVTLSMRLIPGRSVPDIFIVNPQGQTDLPPGEEIEIELSPQEEKLKARAHASRLDEMGARMLAIDDIEGDFLDRFAGSNRMMVRRGSRMLADIPYSRAAGAVRVLRECSDALLGEWGIDPGTKDRISREVVPVGSLHEWIRAKDYPDRAIRAGASGIVLARLDIDETGAITDCTVVGPSGDELIDRRTCRLLEQRGRYHPALDREGRPTGVRILQTVVWATSPRPPASAK